MWLLRTLPPLTLKRCLFLASVLVCSHSVESVQTLSREGLRLELRDDLSSAAPEQTQVEKALGPGRRGGERSTRLVEGVLPACCRLTRRTGVNPGKAGLHSFEDLMKFFTFKRS